MAGLTIGAMVVPQAMAYAVLAGLPAQVGLYAATIPIALYALLGSSRVLAVGPVAVVSLLTATAPASRYRPGTERYIAAAAWLAVLCGVVHLVLSVSRLGFVTDFLSHPVIVGFGSIAVLLAVRRWLPRWPGPLIVVALSIAAVRAFDLPSHGVAVVGTIPSSLPTFGIGGLPASDILHLVPSALVVTLVGFVEAVAVAKFYARRTRQDLSSTRELFALGVANIGAGMFGGYPVNGSLSRTAVMADAGARSGLAGLVSGGVVLLAIVALTPLFEDVPSATLAAIVVVAVIRLIDVAEVRHIFRVKRSEGIGLAVGFVATLVLGVELGIAVAVGTSIIVMFARLTAPNTVVLGRLDHSTFRNVERFPEALEIAGMRIVRVDTPLSFANASAVRRRLTTEIDAAADRGDGLFVLDLSGVNDIDVTGTEILRDVFDHLDDRGLELRMADVKGPVRDVLDRAGLWDRIGHRVTPGLTEAVDGKMGADD